MIQAEKEYLQFLAQGRFMIQRSKSSGNYVFYPRVIQPGSGATDLEWVEACGKGTVHSLTIVRKRTREESYNVVLVDLDEGPRMMSRVDGLPFEEIKIGMKVHARVVQENDGAMVVFFAADPHQQ